MHTLEFFFDCSSPWTYLAFEQIQRSTEGLEVSVEWRPFLVGGVFNTVNPSVYENRQKPVVPKAAYYSKDLQDWANYVGIKIGAPPVFPVNSVKAMRGALVAEEHGRISPYVRAVFEAYWGDLQDISQDEVLAAVAKRVGLERGEFFRKIALPEYKDRLRAYTDELIERGGYGSPTFFVEGSDMYFGNDRLVLIEDALRLAS